MHYGLQILLATTFLPLLLRLGRLSLRDSRLEYIPVILFLFFLAILNKLKEAKMQPDCCGEPFGLALICIGLVGKLLCQNLDILSGEILSFGIVLSGTIITLYGLQVWKGTIWPLLLLCFALPIPHVWELYLGVPLRALATKAATLLLRIAGLATTAKGCAIILPNDTQVFVNEACSGLNSLTAIGAISVYLGNYTSLWSRKLELLFVAIVSALIANIFRLFSLTLFVHLCGTAILDSILHPLVGLLTFLFALTGLLAFNWGLNEN